jgi:hypothetical protein
VRVNSASINLWICLWLALSSEARSEDGQRLTLGVLVEGGASLSVSAETTWLGEERRLELQPHPRQPGLLWGEWSGQPERALSVRLYAEPPGQPRRLVAAETAFVDMEEDELWWSLGPDLRARRVALALPGPEMARLDQLSLLASVGAGLLALGGLALALLRFGPARRPRP